MNAAAAGQTVTLLADVDDVNKIEINKSVTLDMAGHTIKSDGLDESGNEIYGKKEWHSVFVVYSGGALKITGNGTITGPEGEVAAHQDSYTMIHVVGGKLEMDSGTITCGGSAEDGMYAIYVGQIGQVILGDENGNGPTITSYFAALGTVNNNGGANITITGGNYTTTSNPTSTDWWERFCAVMTLGDNGTYTISGGSFKGEFAVLSPFSAVKPNYHNHWRNIHI